MTHLTEEEQAARKDILDYFGHIKARGFKPKESLDQLVREIAFTHLNRLCAYKMMEAREVYVGEQKFREAVSRGVNSNGVKFYLVEHPEAIAERLVRYAGVVGRENVIAGSDCGFSSQATTETEIHPTVVWAKFQAMAEGAALASKELWG